MKKILKLIASILLIQCTCIKLYSQDSSKYSIAYDIFKGFINEHSVTLGYKYNKKYTFKLALGYVFDNKKIREDFSGISPSQDKYPIMVYKGPVIRPSIEFHAIPRFYTEVESFYKYLSYNNHSFYDQNGDHGDISFTRSEKANVFGIHINCGFIIKIPKIHIYFNPSAGVGLTYKHRNYTTTDVEVWASPPEHIDEGTFTKNLFYPSAHIQFNAGLYF